MPLRHGTSHALAVVLCTVLGAFLVDMLRPSFPGMADFFYRIADALVYKLNIPIDPQSLSVVLVATCLAFLWGVVFRLRIRRRR